ncbi:UDP-N-acetylglucosamine 1-carboxyvinyltransferase [Burkholderia latens]|uniref:UDP-N-acetylglucosamine 1-carboxyvinyltransferase n=1 Tax=Burkholderia latens TaxID=488446 RepID=UPI0015886D58|nr:hypothetical protein [Burkholderia latens]
MEIWAKSGNNYHHSAIEAQGSKNAALPLLVASAFTARKSVLQRVPVELEDVRTIIRSLEWFGAKLRTEARVVSIDASSLHRTDLPSRLSSGSRYSLLFLGGLVARCGTARIGPPGGCQFGEERSFDFHRLVLEQFGCELRQEAGLLVGHMGPQRAGEVTLPFPSVGATLQAIIFLTASNRNGVIHNAAIEPEIITVVDFLNKSGCNISFDGPRSLCVCGYPNVGATHVVPVDRIHIATVMAYSAISRTPSTIQWGAPIDLACLAEPFSSLGISAIADTENLYIATDATTAQNRFDVVADVYPGFPTDAVPLIAAATIKSGRKVRFYDKVFSGRNAYLAEFLKFGANVSIISEREFVVNGVPSLTSSEVSTNDIRGSTSLLLAAIQTKTLSRIKNARQIARGYERLPCELKAKGFNVHIKESIENVLHRQSHYIAM